MWETISGPTESAGNEKTLECPSSNTPTNRGLASKRLTIEDLLPPPVPEEK
jgi:hypothetical protein